jgi:hypothetical protein
MCDELTSLAILFGLIAVSLVPVWLEFRGRTKLDDWLAGHALEVVRIERRRLRLGPFAWPPNWPTFVYFLTVRDKAGHAREVWVAVNPLAGPARVSWAD